MATLSAQDHKKVLNFISKLYTPESLNNLPAYFMSALPSLISAEIPGYCTIDFKQGELLGGVPLPSLPDNRVKEVVGDHLDEHPIATCYKQKHNSKAYLLSDFVSEKQLHRMEGVYHQFLRPLGMEEHLTVTLPHNISTTADAIVLFRSERSFTERDRAVLNLLHPHLMQARQLAQNFAQLQQHNYELQQALDMAGVIVINEDNQVQLITHKAEQWLQKFFSSKALDHALPEHLQQWVKHQKSRYLEREDLTPPLPLKVEQENNQLLIRLVPDLTQNLHLLLLEERQKLQLSVESFELLGLSKREAEVLFWVAKGEENSRIAKLLSVTVSTVKKHLEHIYQKLNVNTRTTAVVEALQRLGMLHCQ